MLKIKYIKYINIIYVHYTFYIGYFDLAMKTALQLRDYEDVIDPIEAYSLLGKKNNLFCILSPYF